MRSSSLRYSVISCLLTRPPYFGEVSLARWEEKERAVPRVNPVTSVVSAYGRTPSGFRALFDISFRSLRNRALMLGRSRHQKFLHDPRIFRPPRIAFEQQVVRAFDSDKLGSGDAGCEGSAGGEGDHRVAGRVADQGWGGDLAEQVADVDVGEHQLQRDGVFGRGGHALHVVEIILLLLAAPGQVERGEHLAVGGVVGPPAVA